jgi:drug/metabolite transporter (DMT)-like permease
LTDSGKKTNNTVLCLALLLAIFLWGGTNAGTKFVLTAWPPMWTGGSRFLCAGLLLLGTLRWTDWLGRSDPLSIETRRRLWWRGGLSLAVYIVVFNLAVRHAPLSHVALYLGAAPVWALLWEGRPALAWSTVQRYAAAALALAGVCVLFGPALRTATGSWRGEVLGLAASVLWTNYGRQCRVLGAHLSGAQSSAHTMWRAGVLLMPFGMLEIWRSGLVWRTDLVCVHAYCIVAGGVAAFAIWSQALRHWPTSKVMLFNNLIPLSTMGWAWACLGEPVTRTFWLAMLLIVAGVMLGQTQWQRVFALSRRQTP